MPLRLCQFSELRPGDRFKFEHRFFCKEARDLARVLRDERGRVPLDATLVVFKPGQKVEHLDRRQSGKDADPEA